jgi:hypothetical protein
MFENLENSQEKFAGFFLKKTGFFRVAPPQ